MESKNFQFWYRWLLVVSIANLIAGLIIAFFPDSFIFSHYREALSETFFRSSTMEGFKDLRAFFFGITGGTIAGYFLLQTFIVWGPFRRLRPWAWHSIFWAILLWFVIDSAMSTLHGAFFNVWMINLPVLLLVILPLAMTYTDFRPGKSGYTER